MTWTLDPAAALPCWRLASPAPARVLAFSTRRGGVSTGPFESLNLGRSTADAADAVVENRTRLLSALGLAPERLATAGQVHGAAVETVSAPGHTPERDAIVTTVAGLVLAVTTADCMSLLYSAPAAVAATHAGWRGTRAGIVAATLDALCRASRSTAAQVDVHLGPCIRACCYEVGAEVADAFPDDAKRRVGDTWRLDLPTAATLELVRAGVERERIHDTGACTACEPYWYFSHRRDHGRTGRHWGVIALSREACTRDGGAV